MVSDAWVRGVGMASANRARGASSDHGSDGAVPGTDGDSPLELATPGSVCGTASGTVYGTLQTPANRHICVV